MVCPLWGNQGRNVKQLVTAHPQGGAEDTERMHTCLLDSVQCYASTLAQFRNPCRGNGAVHSALGHPLSIKTISQSPTGQSNIDSSQ